MTQLHDSRDSRDSNDVTYTLGETGQTVVYIFPDGKAHLERGANSRHRVIAAPKSQPAPAQASFMSSALEHRLLHSGLITPAQCAVARHDQAVTGMDLIEVLQMRGWITPETLQTLGQSSSQQTAV